MTGIYQPDQERSLNFLSLDVRLKAGPPRQRVACRYWPSPSQLIFEVLQGELYKLRARPHT